MSEQTQPFSPSGQLIFTAATHLHNVDGSGRGGALEIGTDGTCRILTGEMQPVLDCCDPGIAEGIALETSLLDGNVQIVDGFGAGYYSPDTELSDPVVCWTNGHGHAYFITRLDAGEVSLDFYSPFPDDTRFLLQLSFLEDATEQTFVQQMQVEFWGKRDTFSRLTVPVRLIPSALYRLTILSPTTVSTRNMPLGLGVKSIKLLGKPFSAASGAGRQASGEPADPSNGELHACGVAMFTAGQHIEALRLLSQAVIEGGQTSELWNDWAVACLTCGELGPAEVGFRAAIKNDQGNADAVMNMAVLLARLDRRTEAVTLLETNMPMLPADRRNSAKQLLEACRDGLV